MFGICEDRINSFSSLETLISNLSLSISTNAAINVRSEIIRRNPSVLEDKLWYSFVEMAKRNKDKEVSEIKDEVREFVHKLMNR